MARVWKPRKETNSQARPGEKGKACRGDDRPGLQAVWAVSGARGAGQPGLKDWQKDSKEPRSGGLSTPSAPEGGG